MMMLAQGVLYFLWMRERSVCPLSMQRSS
jgi:hypothetical protein